VRVRDDVYTETLLTAIQQGAGSLAGRANILNRATSTMAKLTLRIASGHAVTTASNLG